MAELIQRVGAPGYIRSDNGPDFIAHSLGRWLAESQIQTLYIDPGCPWQNGYVESFHDKFRRECLGREIFYTLSECRVVIEDWRWKYNHIRPHQSLGYITPIQFAQKETETRDAQGSGSGRPPASLRPNLDFLYDLKHIIRVYQTTLYVAQFG